MAKSVDYLLSVITLHLEYIRTAHEEDEYEDAMKVTKDVKDMIDDELLPRLRQDKSTKERNQRIVGDLSSGNMGPP